MRTNRLVIQCLELQVSQPPSFEVGRDSKTARGEKSFMVIKIEAFRYGLIGGHWHGEPTGELSRSRASYLIVGRAYLAFSDSSCVGS